MVTSSGHTEPTSHTVADAEALRAVRSRLRRAQGQIGGVLSMLEDGRSCRDVVTQLAAVNKAVDKAAFMLIATALRECLQEDDVDAEVVAEQLQKLFLTMA
jgi:DNA-binding FrmR family transcriptional regulator